MVFFCFSLVDSSILDEDLENGKPANRDPPYPVCLDDNGDPVDFWITYKESGTGRYVLLTSKKNMKAPTRYFTHGLDDNRTIEDPETSPMLRTVYQNLPTAGDTSDNRIFMAWNDQQPRVVSTKPFASDDARDEWDIESTQSSADRSAQRDEFTEELRDLDEYLTRKETADEDDSETGSNLDMYGRGVTALVAHSKGMMGLGVDEERGEAHFYLITHSYPRTPNGEWDDDKTIKRTGPTADPRAFFGSNTLNTRSKAQHAMCISMKQPVKIVEGQIEFVRSAITEADNLFQILDGLDLMSPSMTMANYVPWNPQHRIYHQLFNVADVWREQWSEPVHHGSLNEPRQKGQVSVPSTHAFVLWPSHFANFVQLVHGRYVVSNRQERAYEKATSLRTARQAFMARCQRWDPLNVANKESRECIRTARLTTIDTEHPVAFTVDFKHALVVADSDDFVRRHLVPASDLAYSDALDRTFVEAALGVQNISYVVVTQSWFDHRTLGSHEYRLVDGKRYRVNGWFHNSLGVRLPVEPSMCVEVTGPTALPKIPSSSVSPLTSSPADRQAWKTAYDCKSKVSTKLQPSNGLDHSKWFVSYLYGTEGRYLATAGFMDLNRNAKNTRLPGKPYGRGGAFFVTRNAQIVSFLYSLRPLIEDTSNFAQVDLGSLVDDREMSIQPAALVSADGVQNPTMFRVDLRGSANFAQYSTPFMQIEQTPSVALASNSSPLHANVGHLGTPRFVQFAQSPRIPQPVSALAVTNAMSGNKYVFKTQVEDDVPFSHWLSLNIFQSSPSLNEVQTSFSNATSTVSFPHLSKVADKDSGTVSEFENPSGDAVSVVGSPQSNSSITQFNEEEYSKLQFGTESASSLHKIMEYQAFNIGRRLDDDEDSASRMIPAPSYNSPQTQKSSQFPGSPYSGNVILNNFILGPVVKFLMAQRSPLYMRKCPAPPITESTLKIKEHLQTGYVNTKQNDSSLDHCDAGNNKMKRKRKSKADKSKKPRNTS